MHPAPCSRFSQIVSAKTAHTTEPIAELLAKRWSPRSFDPERPIDRKTLVSLFEAARWAPSCFNEQPWRYLVCNRFVDAAAWEKALNCLVEGNRVWARHAPVLIAAIADTLFSRNGKSNRWCDYDTGAASENLCLQAAELELAIHQMGGFDEAAVIAAFQLPKRYSPVAMIALGYPGGPDCLDEEKRKTELAARARNAIDEFVFENAWNEPFGKKPSSG